MRVRTIQACLSLYRSLLIPCGLRVQYGGLADGFTDGPCLKLRTRCLSITMLVHFAFQPLCFYFNIAL